jgi:hypothetical protein
MDVDEAEAEYPSYIQAVSTLDNAMRLYKKLPYDKALDEQHWKLDREMALMHRFSDDAFQMSYDAGIGKAAEAELLKQRLVTDKSEMKKERAGSNLSVPAEIDSFGDLVLKRAEKVQEHQEGQARLWKHISYGLYPLGVVIGLVGKLFGASESVSEQPG